VLALRGFSDEQGVDFRRTRKRFDKANVDPDDVENLASSFAR
jgi:hypothetical protein